MVMMERGRERYLSVVVGELDVGEIFCLVCLSPRKITDVFKYTHRDGVMYCTATAAHHGYESRFDESSARFAHCLTRDCGLQLDSTPNHPFNQVG